MVTHKVKRMCRIIILSLFLFRDESELAVSRLHQRMFVDQEEGKFPQARELRGIAVGKGAGLVHARIWLYPVPDASIMPAPVRPPTRT